MNKLYFSAENVGFYVDGASVVPSGAVEVSEEVYKAFIGVPWPEGKYLGADENGDPVWVNSPPPTQKELTAEAEQHKQRLLSVADDRTSDLKVELMLGTIGDADKATLTAWMIYKKSVKAVDTSNPDEIVWPQAPERSS
jgi:hypothetical protein